MSEGYYQILGESYSDVEAIRVVVQRSLKLLGLPPVKINVKQYDGYGKMFRKGVPDLKATYALGARHFIIHHDSDSENPSARRARLKRELIDPSGIMNDPSCRVLSLIAIQETEAWILADLKAVTKVITSWRPKESFAQPERIASPKERLRKLSEDPRTHKVRYIERLHNPLVAEHLDLEIVADKCPSFRHLTSFVM